MSSISEHFGLGVNQASLDFLNVDVDRDNRLYVDPSMIRAAARRGDPLAVSAYARLERFFDAVLLSVRRLQPESVAQLALREFHEPAETRLGMSRRGFRGSGSSTGLGDDIWHAIDGNPLCTIEVGIFTRVEQIPLFVRNIDKDRVSDLTTRVVFPELLTFTANQMDLHPLLRAGAVRHKVKSWHEGLSTWAHVEGEVPHPRSGEPLVLVPKAWVARSLRMTRSGFLRHGPAAYHQQREATVDARGKVRVPTKRSILARSSMRDATDANRRDALAAWRDLSANLIAAYEARVDSRAEVLEDDRIEWYLHRRPLQ
jgi:hypothetical protein